MKKQSSNPANILARCVFSRPAGVASILLLLALAFNLSAMASTLTLTFTNVVGEPDTNVVKTIPLDANTPVLADGTVYTKGLAKNWTPDTNGTVKFSLTVGNYLITNAFLGKGLVYCFPDSTTNATAYPISGFNTFVKNNQTIYIYTNGTSGTNSLTPEQSAKLDAAITNLQTTLTIGTEETTPNGAYWLANYFGKFVGDGSGLYNLAPTNPVSLSQLPSVVVTNIVFASAYGVAFDGTDQTTIVSNLLKNYSTIYMDGMATVKSVELVSGCRIIGVGPNAGFRCANSVNQPWFHTKLDGNSILSSNIWLENLKLDGNGDNNMRFVTNTSPYYSGTITNIGGTIYSSYAGGSGVQNMGIWFNSVQNLTLKSVTFYNAPTFAATFGGFANNILLENCRSEWPTEVVAANHDGLHFFTPYGTDPSGFKIINHTFINAADDSYGLNGNEFIADNMGWTNGSVVAGRGTTKGCAGSLYILNSQDNSGTSYGIRFLCYKDDGYNWITNIFIDGYSCYPKPGVAIAAMHATGYATPANFVPIRFKTCSMNNVFVGGTNNGSLLLRNLTGPALSLNGFSTSASPSGSDNCYFNFGYGANGGIGNVQLSGLNIAVPPGNVTNKALVFCDNWGPTNLVIQNSIIIGAASNLTYGVVNKLTTQRAILSGSIFPTNMVISTNLSGSFTTMRVTGDSSTP